MRCALFRGKELLANSHVQISVLQVISGINMGSNCGYHMLVALSILGLCIFVDEMTSYLVFAPKFSLM